MIGSKKSKYDYQTTEVTCTCSSCGPQGELVPSYTAKLHTEADKRKQAKGSYVKPSKVMSARDHFQRKAQKITHPSSAASASNLTQISNEDRLRDEIHDSTGDLGLPDDIGTFVAPSPHVISDARSPSHHDTPHENISQTRLPRTTIEEELDREAPPIVSADYIYGNFFDPPSEEIEVNMSSRDVYMAVESQMTPDIPATSSCIPQPSDYPPSISHRGPLHPAVERPPVRSEDAMNSEPPRMPSELLADSTPHWFWQIILLLTSWLHLHYHLPHAACNLILRVLRVIFVTLGALDIESRPPLTLNTTLKRLGLIDEFRVLPTCTKCRRMYPSTSAPDLKCSVCQIAIFRSIHGSGDDVESPILESRPLKVKPILVTPTRPISEQLESFINQPGVEEALDAWRTRKRHSHKLTDISDGRIWGEIRGHDGRLFFENGNDRPDPDELRLALTMNFDGFSFERSHHSGSHSSGVLSNSCANLPTSLRYRPTSLLFYGISPGPKEADHESLQNFMRDWVDDLLMLYDDGIIIRTRKFPEGRRVRVILLAVCCDHPALCKVCGFADHKSKQQFCHRCKITQADLATELGMSINAFEARDGATHRRHAQEWQRLPERDREDFFKEHGARYFELSRLPYFDPVRMTVVDPMHNILLGIVKTHWLNAWVQGKVLRERTPLVARELDQIHGYLEAFEMPTWVACLPHQVGYPAGGSLAADEWKGLVMVYCPVVIPMVWDEWYPVAVADYLKKTENWDKNEQARLKRVAKGKQKAGGKDNKPIPKPAPMRMDADDADIFLKLSAALKIVMARSIDVADLPRAQQLLQDYLLGFLRIHGDHVKPNFHWVTHIFDQILDYGPVYGFWTFVFERLNKVLKSYSTNNHAGGELETTFVREFMRNTSLRHLVSIFPTAIYLILFVLILVHLLSLSAEDIESSPETDSLHETIQMLLMSDGDTRGTVAALSREIDESAADVDIRFSLGDAVKTFLSAEDQSNLIEYYQTTYPDAGIISRDTVTDTTDANFLLSRGLTHKHLILDGRRILPSESLTRAHNSIVQVDYNGTQYVGQLVKIISHNQPQVPQRHHFASIRWFKRLDTFNTAHWDPYHELEVFVWEHNSFLSPSDDGPPRIIPVTSILSQAARLTISQNDRGTSGGYDSELEDDAIEATLSSVKVWVTIGLTLVLTNLFTIRIYPNYLSIQDVHLV